MSKHNPWKFQYAHVFILLLPIAWSSQVFFWGGGLGVIEKVNYNIRPMY